MGVIPAPALPLVVHRKSYRMLPLQVLTEKYGVKIFEMSRVMRGDMTPEGVVGVEFNCGQTFCIGTRNKT